MKNWNWNVIYIDCCRVSDVYPEMKVAAFKCTRCNHYVYSPLERAHVDEPNDCEVCHTKNAF